MDVLKKGTKLYRIRDCKKEIKLNNPEEFLPPPSPQSMNRANEKGETALYLASSSDVCLLETHINIKQKYVLFEYECVEDINLASFANIRVPNDNLRMVPEVLNAMFIAPSRSAKNDELFNTLVNHYGKPSPYDINDVSDLISMELPLKFGILNKNNDTLYNITNKMCNVLKSSFQSPIDGIRYSSCYIPLEDADCISSYYNVVLYEKAIGKLRPILPATEKVNDKRINSIESIKMIWKG